MWPPRLAGCKINFDDLQGETKYSPWRAYKQSKLANILFTRELARRLEGTGVTANALHPGYVRTRIFRAEGFQGWLLRRGRTVRHHARRGSADLDLPGGLTRCGGTDRAVFRQAEARLVSPESQDEATARGLWEVSARLTGLSPS